MSTADTPPPEARRTRTFWLLAGGAASLLLPLLGVLYMRWSDGAGAPGPSGRADLFEHREGGERKIVPSQAPVMPSALVTPPPQAAPAAAQSERAAGSSLDFIKSNADLKAKVAETPPAAATPAPPAPSPAVAAAPPAKAKTKAKPSKKPFTMPKLQPTRGFTNMGGAKGSSAETSSAGQNPQDVLKNLPPGAENDPRVQEYLKSQGR